VYHLVQKVRGSRSAVPYTKKREENSMFFTRVAPRTKSKGLPIGAPHILYYFQNGLRHVQKASGSIGMCFRFIILLIKFLEVFAAQLMLSSLYIIHTISHQIPIGGAIYFSYTTVINIREVRDIYLYLSESSSSSMQKKKITEPWGCRCHRTRQD
jgi:hypothetical protein